MNSELDGICQDCFRYSKVQDKIDTLEKTIEYAKRIEKEYKTKVDKVIEYLGINEEILETCGIYDVNGIEVYKILQGSDKE